MANTTRKVQSPDEEVLARLRRIETRVTQLMIGLGVTTQGQKPGFDTRSGRLTVPSMHSSLQEILDSVPQGWQGPIRVCIGEKQLVTIELQ